MLKNKILILLYLIGSDIIIKNGQNAMNSEDGGKTMNWTNEQEKAIFEKNKNILVAAAAR